jgi:hypothetical protein
MRLYEILESINRRNFMKGAAAIATTSLVCPMCKGAHAALPLLDRTLKHPRLFNDYTLQRKVFLKVVEEYNKLTYDRYKSRIDLNVSLPTVLASFDATPEELKKSLGIALDTSRQTINHYDRFLNRILLAPSAEIDSLAHELVHFIQFKYVPFADPYSDWMETQAIEIQNGFNWKSLY